jgi:hypothetical protein
VELDHEELEAEFFRQQQARFAAARPTLELALDRLAEHREESLATLAEAHPGALAGARFLRWPYRPRVIARYTRIAQCVDFLTSALSPETLAHADWALAVVDELTADDEVGSAGLVVEWQRVVEAFVDVAAIVPIALLELKTLLAIEAALRDEAADPGRGHRLLRRYDDEPTA